MVESVFFLLLAVSMPIALSSLSNIGTGNRKRFFIKSTLLSVFAANAIMLLIWLLFQSTITRYELLFVNALVAILIIYLCVPLYKNRKLSPTEILKLSCICVIALVTYSNLTFGQTALHSDSATASLLTKAQVKYGDFFPDTWYYVNGDIWVLSSQIFTAPFAILMNNQSLARMLGSVTLCILTSLVIFFHNKKAFQSDAWVIAIPLLFLFIIGQRNMIIYEAAYLSQMLLLSIYPFLYYKIYKNICCKWIVVVFSLLTVLMTMGGIRFVAEQILPLWCTCLTITYFEIRKNDSIDWKKIFLKCLRFSISILLPTIIGLAVYVYLKRTHNVVYSANGSIVFNDSFKTCLNVFSVYISNLLLCFGFTGNAYLISLDGILNLISIIMCLLIVFIVPVLQAIKLKHESEYVRFFYMFAVIHNIIMFIMIIFFAAKTNTQYVLTSIFVDMIVSARYIYTYWIKQNHFEKYIWTGLFLIASMFGCVDMALDSIGWEEKVLSQKSLQQQLIDRGLTKGYGDFWPVYGQEVYSDFKIEYGGLLIYEGIPSRFYWLVDGNVFEPEDKETFLILTDRYNREVAPNIPTLFEEPIDYFELDGHHIYVFDYDIAVDIP